ncbi:phosphatidylinositol N-acetylglucosaminyltransferase-domain-containing protein [Apiospora arundinis]|uniref:Phosphatidylinositol N-acetylglucosaminyltransferase-domain-containing protein n=1 Tax=Apiospora arundinis TaxID=335852 RepID=A0ABR2HR02_9PEZI
MASGTTGTGIRQSVVGPYSTLTPATSSVLPLDALATSPRSSRSHLAPEDAFINAAASPPRRSGGFDHTTGSHHNNMSLLRDTVAAAGAGGGDGRASSRRRESKFGSRSRSRRRKRNWKKILWVKQSYPDNYTDQTTFLDSLQRNPRLQPYEFWPLVADTTVIVQQVCSVTIFVVCFVGIFTERVSPVAVVGWGSFATFLGWAVWDWWVGQEGEDEVLQRQNSHRSRGAWQPRHDGAGSANSTTAPTTPSATSSVTNLGSTERTTSQGNLTAMRSQHGGSVTSLHSNVSHSSRLLDPQDGLRHRPSSPLRRGRATLRLSTIKSASLIYFTILGLSPILKSLTRSTSPDSIWAMSFLLLAINIFFFDYSGGVGVKFPASLSTNAALMASTVLASRLPSTGQVFSLTLFSIEVFGLFPVFRRYARHRSWRYHVALTVLLTVGAGGGMGLILGEGKDGVWPWKSGLLGVSVGAFIVIVAMGASSWWLIGLQKYKNAMNGPWDQARPIIISRRQWEYD